MGTRSHHHRSVPACPGTRQSRWKAREDQRGPADDGSLAPTTIGHEAGSVPAVERVVAKVADVREPMRSVGRALDGRAPAFRGCRGAVGGEALLGLLLCLREPPGEPLFVLGKT